MNVVCLLGRLTADPQLRRTASDIPMASFTVAVDGRTSQRAPSGRRILSLSLPGGRRRNLLRGIFTRGSGSLCKASCSLGPSPIRMDISARPTRWWQATFFLPRRRKAGGRAQRHRPSQLPKISRKLSQTAISRFDKEGGRCRGSG